MRLGLYVNAGWGERDLRYASAMDQRPGAPTKEPPLFLLLLLPPLSPPRLWRAPLSPDTASATPAAGLILIAGRVTKLASA